ncbi:hypothetical protein AAY473_017416 [Plecturocebus cupreus]
MQSCPGLESQSQEQRAGRRRQQIIAKCLASTVGPRCRKVWSQRQERVILSVLQPAASLHCSAGQLASGAGPSASRKSWPNRISLNHYGGEGSVFLLFQAPQPYVPLQMLQLWKASELAEHPPIRAIVISDAFRAGTDKGSSEERWMLYQKKHRMRADEEPWICEEGKVKGHRVQASVSSADENPDLCLQSLTFPLGLLKWLKTRVPEMKEKGVQPTWGAPLSLQTPALPCASCHLDWQILSIA